MSKIRSIFKICKMSRIEKTLKELSELRDFYFKLQKRFSTQSSTGGLILSPASLKAQRRKDQ